jgi:hypothetical protein
MTEIVTIQYDQQSRRDVEVIVGSAATEELARAFCQLLAAVEGGWFTIRRLSAQGSVSSTVMTRPGERPA